jgi:serine protease Do
MLSLGTKLSDVTTGFPAILQHDQPINPQDCGGPIVDLSGHVSALNIARAGRVATYAIPATVLAKLLHGVDFEKLATPAPVPEPAK